MACSYFSDASAYCPVLKSVLPSSRSLAQPEDIGYWYSTGRVCIGLGPLAAATACESTGLPDLASEFLEDEVDCSSPRVCFEVDVSLVRFVGSSDTVSSLTSSLCQISFVALPTALSWLGCSVGLTWPITLFSLTEPLLPFTAMFVSTAVAGFCQPLTAFSSTMSVSSESLTSSISILRPFTFLFSFSTLYSFPSFSDSSNNA